MHLLLLAWSVGKLCGATGVNRDVFLCETHIRHTDCGYYRSDLLVTLFLNSTERRCSCGMHSAQTRLIKYCYIMGLPSEMRRPMCNRRAI